MAAKDTIATAAKFTGVGFSLGATVVVAIWGGNWLDQRLGTSPLFLMLFLVGGLAGFMQRLLWMLKKSKDGG